MDGFTAAQIQADNVRFGSRLCENVSSDRIPSKSINALSALAVFLGLAAASPAALAFADQTDRGT